MCFIVNSPALPQNYHNLNWIWVGLKTGFDDNDDAEEGEDVKEANIPVSGGGGGCAKSFSCKTQT